MSTPRKTSRKKSPARRPAPAAPKRDAGAMWQEPIGRYVVVRTYSAGVHCGFLIHRQGSEVVLGEASRIWRWRGANTIHEIALGGVSLEEHTRISEQVEEIILTGAIEIVPTTPVATANLRQPRWLP